MSALDALEADFFGDLAQDTHGVWEVFEFVRLHYPDLTDEQVFERGHDYIFALASERLVSVSLQTKPSNQSMKPTASFGSRSSDIATTPCRGLSLSR